MNDYEHNHFVEKIQGTILTKIEYISNADIKQLGVVEMAYQLMLAEEIEHIETNRIANEIIKIQENDGSWNNEIWDTSIVIKSLIPYIKENRKIKNSAIRGSNWLRSRRLRDNSWHNDPWETMLAISVLLKFDLKFCYESILWLENFREPSGKLLSLHYTALYCKILLEFVEGYKKGDMPDQEQNFHESHMWLIQNLDMLKETKWGVVMVLDYSLNIMDKPWLTKISTVYLENIVDKTLSRLNSNELDLLSTIENFLNIIKYYKRVFPDSRFSKLNGSIECEIRKNILNNISGQIADIFEKRSKLVKKTRMKYLLGIYIISLILVCVGIVLIDFRIEFLLTLLFTIVLSTFLETNLRTIFWETFWTKKFIR